MTNDKQRKRLVELLQEASAEAGKYFRETTKKVLAEKGRFSSKEDIDRKNIYEIEADHLLANDVMVLPYKPFPVVLSEDENNSDVFCPFCDTDLSGNYYGGDYEPPKIVPCFGCGTWLDGTKAITKEEAEEALKAVCRGE